MLEAVGTAEADPDPVTGRVGVEGIRAYCVEDDLFVAHVQQHVEHPLEHAGEDAEAILASVVVMAPGILILGPLVRVAVQEGLSRQHDRLKVEGPQGLRRIGIAVQEVGTTLQR